MPRTTKTTTTRPRRSEAGFSIVEVLVAGTILLSALVAVASLTGTIFKVGANSRFKQQATEIAAATLDTQIATGPSALLNETGDTSLTSVSTGGIDYGLEMEVAPYDPSNAQCVSPASDSGAMLKVTIWATWSEQPSGAAWWLSGPSSTVVEETSLLAVPSSVVNPNDGSILVAVQNAAGNGVADLPVTATPSTGTAQTVTTTAGGCALFSNIAATSGGSPTWTVSFGTKTGYVTEQELTTLPSQSALSVAADATTSLYFEPSVSPYDAYDQAATVTPSYVVPQINGGLHPALPSNINSMPLSFYNTKLQTNPYVTTSPSTVFPMSSSPSYTVVSGSCGTDSAPDGTATDGQAVTVSPGASASPTMTLVPVQIYVVNQSQSNAIVSPATLTASASNAAGTGSDPNCPTTGPGVMPTLQLGSTTATWTALHRAPPHHKSRGHGHGTRPGPWRPGDGVLVARELPGPGAPGTAAQPAGGPLDQWDGTGVHHAVLLATCSSSCATTTTLSSNLNPSTAGASVTFTATVACSSSCSVGTPSGTVTFKDNGTNITGCVTVSMSSGRATCSVSTLALGTQTITAAYASSQTSKWSNSTSSNLSQVVNPAPTTTTLSSGTNPYTYGSSTVLTATVSCSASGCGTPSGSVTFNNNGTAITGCVAVNLSSGRATCTLSGLNAGSYSLTGAYTPSANYNSSTSNTVTQTVNAASTSTTLSSSPNPNAYGTSAILTATVSCSASGCGTPTGTVTFKNNGANITGCTSVTVTSGAATCTLSGLNGGTYSVSASFTPTTDFGSSTSNTVTQSVTAASTTTTLGASANPSTYNSSVTLTATVTPASGAPAVGTVSFYDTTTLLGTASVNSSDQATLVTSTLTIGVHSLSAVFTPTNSANFGSSTSSTLSDAVNAPAGAAYMLVGLPCGVWHLSATYTVGSTTYSSTNATVQVVITVTASTITVTTGGSYVTAQSVGTTAPIVTVYIK